MTKSCLSLISLGSCLFADHNLFWAGFTCKKFLNIFILSFYKVSEESGQSCVVAGNSLGGFTALYAASSPAATEGKGLSLFPSPVPICVAMLIFFFVRISISTFLLYSYYKDASLSLKLFLSDFILLSQCHASY